MEDGINRYKYFMRFLLEGNIIPSLKALRVSSILCNEPYFRHQLNMQLLGKAVWKTFHDNHTFFNST